MTTGSGGLSATGQELADAVAELVAARVADGPCATTSMRVR
ncbi:hypothetical protein [Pseudonocardia sp. ICBG1293]|nr:hypothetical protein [Pseudonocardia sp. ICBG1293]